MKPLEGRVAIITGGTSGIGKASACRFAKEGASVMITGRNEERAIEAVEEIRSQGGTASYVLADLSDYRQAPEKIMNATLEEFGTVDILFNNAGMLVNKPAQETTVDEFLEMFNTEVTSHVRLTQLAYPIMKEKGKGSILFCISISGFEAAPNDLSYTTAKHALVGTVKRLAYEYGPEVRVNGIAPGSTDTLMIREVCKSIGLETESPDFLLPSIALKRHSQPEEQANVAFFLVSDEASYVDGQILRVDGGIDL